MEKSFINFYTANRMKHPCAIHSLLDKQKKTLNKHSRISSKKYNMLEQTQINSLLRVVKTQCKYYEHK